MNFSQFPTLMKDAYNEWSEDNCLRLGASLAYYTLSSLIPLLLIVAAVASFFLNFTGQGQNLREDLANRIAETVRNEQLAEQITAALGARAEDAASKGKIGRA